MRLLNITDPQISVRAQLLTSSATLPAVQSGGETGGRLSRRRHPSSAFPVSVITARAAGGSVKILTFISWSSTDILNPHLNPGPQILVTQSAAYKPTTPTSPRK